MFSRISHYVGMLTCLAITGACFMPWVHYNSIHETFTGYHVTRFPTGNYYGRAGIVITIFAAVILLLTVTPRIWAKRVNLFITSLLLAYSIRTYIIFTSALFPGEVEKKSGIYLIVLLSVLLMICAAFPRLELKNNDTDK